MKVLLMVAPEEYYMVASVHKALDHKREARPLLGILSVATYLKNRRPEIDLKFIDGRAEALTFADMAQRVHEYQPDVVGLTCLTFNYYDTLRMARLIKEACPIAKVCIGGWHTTLYPKETLIQKDVDYVVFGEGERTFLELVDAVSQGRDPVGILGLGFKSHGKAVVNAARPAEDEPKPKGALASGSPIIVQGELAERMQRADGLVQASDVPDGDRLAVQHRSRLLSIVRRDVQAVRLPGQSNRLLGLPGEQRAVDAATTLQHGGEEATLAHLRNLQLDVAGLEAAAREPTLAEEVAFDLVDHVALDEPVGRRVTGGREAHVALDAVVRHRSTSVTSNR